MFVMLLYVLIGVVWLLAAAGLFMRFLGYGAVEEGWYAMLFLALVTNQVAAILREHRQQIRSLSARLDELASVRKQP